MFLNPLLLGLLSLIISSCAHQEVAPSQPSAPVAKAPAAASAPADGRVVVLYFSDLHGRLRGQNGGGGYARLAALLAGERAKAGPNTDVLVLFGGDAAGKSSLPCRKTGERACFPLLKGLGIDVAVLGNGELRLGLDALNPLLHDSNVTWIGPNSRARGGHAAWLNSYRYVGPKSGARFFVTGWSIAPSPGEVDARKSRIENLREPGAAEFAAWARESKSEPILWLTHQELPDDLKLLTQACATKGLNNLALLKAHDHAQVEDKSLCAPIYEPGAFGNALSRLEIARGADGQWKIEEHRFVPLTADLPEDSAMKNEVEALYQRHAPDADEVLAKLDQPLDQGHLTQWLADAFRAASRADVAIVNAGAVKSGIERGEVKKDDLLAAIPYEDDLMGLDWSLKEFEKSLCRASMRPRDSFEDYGSELVLSGAKLVDAGTPRCRIETGRRSNLKVVMVSFLVRRSGRWLGKDLSAMAFRFGFKSDTVMFNQLRKSGFQ